MLKEHVPAFRLTVHAQAHTDPCTSGRVGACLLGTAPYEGQGTSFGTHRASVIYGDLSYHVSPSSVALRTSTLTYWIA
jgi:hypothetical protein